MLSSSIVLRRKGKYKGVSVNKYKQLSVNIGVQITVDMNICIKGTLKICLLFVNEFWVLLLGVKNEKLGIRLEENICRKKEDKI